MVDSTRPDPQLPASIAGAVDLSGLAASAGAPANTAPQGVPGGDTSPAVPLPDVVINGGEQELEQFAQLSTRMPVLVEMHAAWSHESGELSPVLEQVVRSANGRIALLRIDLDAFPQLGRQPQVLALFGGQPMPLFQGSAPRDQIEALVGELLQAAAQRGLTGTVTAAADGTDTPPQPTEPELPPLHREAREALHNGDIAGAKEAYERALKEQPADDAARRGLAQVNLLDRLQGKTLAAVRERAAEQPGDLDAQLDVADLDLSGGHVDDAFARLLGLYPKQDADGKNRLRERILDYFEVVGGDDERVKRARQQLTNLLFS